MTMSNPCCECDRHDFPGKLDIGPGLPALPRQQGDFAAYRQNMLNGVGMLPALGAWRAREGDDLGLMLLEMWAVVLDILGFYDERIANESYVRTAALDRSAWRLTQLLGYRPSPAVGSEVTVSLIATGTEPVPVPAGTAFRSEPFDDQPPHVFETSDATTAYPKLSRWTLAPIRRSDYDGVIYLGPRSPGVAVGQVALLLRNGGEDGAWPGRVAAVETAAAVDGQPYTTVSLDPSPTVPAGTRLDELTLYAMPLVASPSPYMGAPVGTDSLSRTTIVLDTMYPQIRKDGWVVVETEFGLHASRLVGVARESVSFNTKPSDRQIPDVFAPADVGGGVVLGESDGGDTEAVVQATEVTLDPAIPADWGSGADLAASLRLHFKPVFAGSPTRPAEIFVSRSDLSGGVAFVPPAEPLADTPGPATVQIKGAQARGAQIDGTVEIGDDGTGALTPIGDGDDFDPPLRTTVEVFGNLVDATRGESVIDEVLGSGNASVAFQRFKLKKSPLTYLSDATLDSGVRPEIEVRVNGVAWTYVETLFGTGPEDEVYTLQQDESAVTSVIFGDGETGARPATGVGNITATYRFGAGSAKPPAGAISQLAKPVSGLSAVINPVPARGGSDADATEDLRENAPASALTLGRAVSLADFEAIARAQPGVVNAAAGWAWSGSFQQAAVLVWLISDGESVAADVDSTLRGKSARDTPLSVVEAEAIDTQLSVDLEIDGRYDADAVRASVTSVLIDEETGILTAANVPIGRPLFRSVVVAKIHSVDGVVSVRGLNVDGVPMGLAMVSPQGAYRRFFEVGVS